MATQNKTKDNNKTRQKKKHDKEKARHQKRRETTKAGKTKKGSTYKTKSSDTSDGLPVFSKRKGKTPSLSMTHQRNNWTSQDRDATTKTTHKTTKHNIRH